MAKKLRFLVLLIISTMLCSINIFGFEIKNQQAGQQLIDKGYTIEDVLVQFTPDCDEAQNIYYIKSSEESSRISKSNIAYSTPAYKPASIQAENSNSLYSGNLGTYNIIGDDDGRTPVSNTTTYPNSSIMYLQITAPSGSTYRGTAFMVNATQALTAGHNLYNPSKYGGDGVADKVVVYPGRNGLNNYPFGSYTASKWTIPGEYINNQSSSVDYCYDWAVIDFSSNVGNVVGYLSVQYVDAEYATSNTITVRGYPRYYNNGTTNQYIMYTMSGNILKDTGSSLRYTIDTSGGNSGSPVMLGSSYNVIGIHSEGRTNYNIAYKIGATCFAFIGGDAGGGGFSDGT